MPYYYPNRRGNQLPLDSSQQQGAQHQSDITWVARIPKNFRQYLAIGTRSYKGQIYICLAVVDQATDRIRRMINLTPQQALDVSTALSRTASSFPAQGSQQPVPPASPVTQAPQNPPAQQSGSPGGSYGRF